MTSSQQSSKTAKLLYRPVGIGSSMLGGIIAATLFKQIWKRVGSDDAERPPSALSREYPVKEILLAALIQGAIYAVVKTAIDRKGAEVYEKATGVWPGQ
ncbi:DUF4235 domain-containing protein [soil metagenome]